MKRFYSYFLAFVVATATMTAVTSCETIPADDVTPDASAPTVSSVAVDETSITTSSASIEVTYANVVELYYSYYVVGAEADAQYTSVAVEADSTTKTIELAELEAETSYEIKVYGVDAEEVKSDEVTENFTTAPIIPVPTVSGVVVDEASITTSSASIEVTYSDVAKLYYAYYVVGADQENVEYTSVEVEAGSTSKTIELAELKAATAYEIKVYGEDAEEVASEELSGKFKTLVPENDYYSVENLVAAPASISADLILKDGCDGVIFYANSTADFNIEEINNMISGGYGIIIKKSGKISIMPMATPATAYKYIIVPICNIGEEEDQWGNPITTCEIAGSLEDYYVEEVTTAEFDTDYVITNATDAKVTLGDVTADITSISVVIDRVEGDDIVTTYCGAVKTSDLGTQSAIEWAVANKFFDTAYPSVFVDEWTNVTTTNAYIGQLSDETAYTIFAVPVTASGAFGTAVTTEVTTKGYDVTVNESLKPTVVITPGLQTADVVITFGDCAKVFYDQYAMTLSDAKASIYAKVSYNGDNYVAADYGTSVTHTMYDLTPGTEYTFYCMGVDADGTYGAICECTFTTKSLNWGGATTATVTQVSGTYNNEYGEATVVFNVDISDDTAKATVSRVDKDYVFNDVPKAWGDYILTHTWDNQYLTADGEVTVTFYHKNYKFVVVTEDASGAYGIPTVVEIDWDSIPEYEAPVE